MSKKMSTEEMAAAMAYWAGAETRATAALVEMLAAACLMKLSPPTPGNPVELVIHPDDMRDAVHDFRFVATYDDIGAMTIRMEVTS